MVSVNFLLGCSYLTISDMNTSNQFIFKPILCLDVDQILNGEIFLVGGFEQNKISTKPI